MINVMRFMANYLSISFKSVSISLGVVVGGKRFTVAPSREIRNLVKFHLMSLSFSTLLLMLLNSVAEALAFSPLYSSVGAWAFKY